MRSENRGHRIIRSALVWPSQDKFCLRSNPIRSSSVLAISQRSKCLVGTKSAFSRSRKERRAIFRVTICVFRVLDRAVTLRIYAVAKEVSWVQVSASTPWCPVSTVADHNRYESTRRRQEMKISRTCILCRNDAVASSNANLVDTKWSPTPGGGLTLFDHMYPSSRDVWQP